jgi:hypothetical protein
MPMNRRLTTGTALRYYPEPSPEVAAPVPTMVVGDAALMPRQRGVPV